MSLVTDDVGRQGKMGDRKLVADLRRNHTSSISCAVEARSISKMDIVVDKEVVESPPLEELVMIGSSLAESLFLD